jgi:hypothetical protein
MTVCECCAEVRVSTDETAPLYLERDEGVFRVNDTFCIFFNREKACHETHPHVRQIQFYCDSFYLRKETVCATEICAPAFEGSSTIAEVCAARTKVIHTVWLIKDDPSCNVEIAINEREIAVRCDCGAHWIGQVKSAASVKERHCTWISCIATVAIIVNEALLFLRVLMLDVHKKAIPRDGESAEFNELELHLALGLLALEAKIGGDIEESTVNELDNSQRIGQYTANECISGDVS